MAAFLAGGKYDRKCVNEDRRKDVQCRKGLLGSGTIDACSDEFPKCSLLEDMKSKP